MRTPSTLLFCLAIAACADATPPPPVAPTAPTSGSVDTQTPAQHLLAHFRSADGMVALTLDRTGAKPKYQVDGSPDIVELTQKEQRETWNGHLSGYFFVDPKGERSFFIDEGGGVTFRPDQDHYVMRFDKASPPLGAPTLAGVYAPPPPPYQATVTRLQAIAVLTKLPDVKAQDASNLAKVADVFGRATADMFVHYATHGQTDWLPSVHIVPESFHGVSFGGVGHTSSDKWDPKSKGLAHFGGKNQGFSFADTPHGNHMQVQTLDGYAPHLADGTPGIVWEVNGTSATLVTLDGDRYEVDLSKADKGQTLDAGAVPQKNVDDLLALDVKWTECAAKVWTGAQRAIDSGHFTEADRKDYEKKARVTCASIISSQEGMLVKLVEARLKERLDLFAKAKARVASLGADH